jgi:phage protein D
MHPVFRVSGGPAGATIEGPSSPDGRAVGIQLVDQTGAEADELTVTIDDREPFVAIPAKGTTLSVEMGYLETGLMFMGTFIIEEVIVSGFPRAMEVVAKSANMTGQSQLKAPRTQDYQGKDVEGVMGIIAGRGGLAAMVSPLLGSIKQEYWGQTEESDMNFITRLAAEHDAFAKIANGKLMFMKKGESLSGSGMPVGEAIASIPENVIQYQATFQSRSEYADTVAAYWDGAKAKRTEMMGKIAAGIAGASAVAKIAAMYPDGDKQAERAAKARSSRLARETGTLRISIIGDPGVMAGTILQVENVRPVVDGPWWVTKVTHTIDGTSGYETVIEAELSKGAAHASTA